MPRDDTDAESMSLRVRVSADPTTDEMLVELDVPARSITVTSRGKPLRAVVRDGAERLAQALSEQGCEVTTADVLRSIEEALETSVVVDRDGRLVNTPKGMVS